MARTGKIARLPGRIREELNLRMRDGALGRDLVDWLNGLDPVKNLLARHFAGNPISEQNLSEWRQGGFREWLVEYETRRRIDQFISASNEINGAALDQDIPARLSALLATELAAHTQLLLAETADPLQRFQVIRNAIRSLQTLRNSDRAAAHAEREQYEWEEKLEDAEIAACKAHNDHIASQARHEAMRPYLDAVHDRFMRSILPKTQAPQSTPQTPSPIQNQPKPNPAESNPIKPNPT